jgi:hypothetical protein
MASEAACGGRGAASASKLRSRGSDADVRLMTVRRMRRVSFALATSLAAVALFAAGAEARSCGSAVAGTAYFSKITATGVTCATAKRLLDGTTLTRNRGGASFWRYAGWQWSITGLDETSNGITGKRGKARIRATWSQG